jgi:hypothetical protein
MAMSRFSRLLLAVLAVMTIAGLSIPEVSANATTTPDASSIHSTVPEHSGTSTSSGTHTFVIQAANSSFTDTGLELSVGQTVSFSSVGDGSCAEVDNPSPICPVGEPNGYALCSTYSFAPGPAGANVPFNSVAGKIGTSGTPFLVGKSSSQNVTQAGELFLVFNDCSPNTEGYVGNGGSYTVTVTVSSQLQVSLDATLPAGGVAVGQSVPVTVTVTAGSSALSSVNLSDLTIDASGSSSSSTGSTPTPILSVTSTPDGTTGFSLAANATKTFTYQLQVTATGTAAIGITADGTEADGTKVTDSAQTKIHVGAKSLTITLASTPGTINLPVDDKGAIGSKTVNVTVTFTNTTKKTISDVQLIGLDPIPQDKTQALTQLALPAKSIPATIGDVKAGAKVKRVFSLAVTVDGAYQWNALALYDDPSAKGGNGRSSAVGGPFEAKVPPLYFTSDTEPDNIYKQGGADWVRAGDSWFIKGTIKNESSYKTLCVLPLIPTFTGNAAGIGPHDVTVASIREDAPPFAGILKPGDSATIAMYVDTSVDGSTRGKVDFDPQAAVLDAGATCSIDTVGDMTQLGDDDKTIPDGTDEETVHVDTSNPIPLDRSWPETQLYLLGAIPGGVLHGLFDSAVGLEASAGDAVSLDNLYTTLNSLYPEQKAGEYALGAYQQLVTATDVIADYWKSATPDEQQSFVTQVESVLRRESGDFYKAALGTAADATKTELDQFEATYAKGDDADIFALYGHGIGSLGAQILAQIVLNEIGTSITQKAPALTAAFKEVAGSSVTITALKDMPASKLLNFTEMRNLWGLSQQDFDAFSKIAKEYDVLIGVRGRSPISVENIEEGAVWKHENLKPKNVSSIDIEYLGFPASGKGTVQFRTYSYSEEHALLTKIQAADLPAAEYKVVIDRLETRIGESKYIKTIQGFSKEGEINVGFNYADNGIDKTTSREIRKFTLVESTLEDGGTLYTPYQENLKYYNLRKTGTLPSRCKRLLGSVLCEVTGDMDGVYVTTTAGTAVPQDKLVKIYEALQKAGWQHPETLTWINSAGEFYFAAKEKILQGLQLGGEATIQITPTGNAYATYIDLAKSKLISPTNYYLDLVGGFTTLAKAG